MQAQPALLPQQDAAPRLTEKAERLTSLDVFRGFTMLFMASEIMGISHVLKTFTGSSVALFAADWLDHKQWVGCSPWDLIQPSFMFMAGVSLPFSLASRAAKGHSFARMLRHAVSRSLILIALGIFLRSQHRAQTYFTFEDVLTQIGLGYTFLFLLARTKPQVQAIVAAAILVLYWLAFALTPLPPPGFDTTTVGVPADWPHQLSGFAAHWNKNTNFAHYADVWFLNLFPREKPFAFNGGGYLTLNFVPSLATMIFGLLAGEVLKSKRTHAEKLRLLLMGGAAGLILGAVLHFAGVCPIVKRIWTPSWALFSTGWALLFLAAWYWLIDVRGYKKWAFPLLVVGMNSIAMYFLVHVIVDYTGNALKIHLGQHVFERFGTLYAPILEGAAVLAILWLMLLWMYRRKIFLRV